MAEDNTSVKKEALQKTKLIQELKEKLKGIMDNELYEDDNLFYRFLKAQDLNVDNAKVKLKQHIEWRKKYDVKNISKLKHPEVLEKYLPYEKLGHDKEGCVIRYMPSGNIDWIGILTSCKLEGFTKRLLACTEDDIQDLKIQSKKHGKTIDKIVYIHNLENFSFAKATNKKVVYASIFFLNMYQNQYPETLKAIYVINASIYFNLFYSLLCKFLPSSIINKVNVFSDDSWKEEFLNIIDAKILPAFLGGSRTDPDGNPLCHTFINHGEPVPEKYYIHRSKRSLADLPDVQKLILSRAAFYEVFVEVKTPDSFLEWEFETKCRDIGFGLFHQDDEGKTEIIPLQRINTDEYAESGIYKCEKIGTYIVIFDNTYSVFRAKEIFYKIKVLSYLEEESQMKN